jgi:hypothetical protein
MAKKRGKSVVIEKLRETMLEPVGSMPADTSKFLASETALWGQVVKATGASLR